MNYDPFGGKRKIQWDPSEQIVEEVTPPPTPVTTMVTVKSPVTQVPVQSIVQSKVKITRNRTGNGHKKQKVRDLIDTERNFFRSTFLTKNGQIEDDLCTVLKQSVDDVVAIFQITGFISYLHREVAQNRLELQDLQAYCNWIHARYAELWEQWNRPAFVNVRRMNAANRAAGRPLVSVPREQSPTVFIPARSPKFVAFQRRGTYARTGT